MNFPRHPLLPFAMAERFINLVRDGLNIGLHGRVGDVQVQQIHRLQ